MGATIIGNVIAILFFILFQVCGITIIRHLLWKEKRPLRLLIGSVTGSILLHWLPTLYSFFLSFNRLSNLLAAGTAMLITAIIVYRYPVKQKEMVTGMKESYLSRYGIWFLIVPVFIFCVLILNTHTIQFKTGSIYTGQCTYGDMNLHLGIVTSIAKQGTFPPEYSIFPGTKLSYPFLADSISSSLYVFGCSLRLAYILPMLIALLQVFYGFYYFVYTWMKKRSVAVFAWILFFFSGGFGFAYFLENAVKKPENFTRVFTEFYKAPTNLVDSNIRWVNSIVDMLLPQRATLFGYAILFPVLALLYTAIKREDKKDKKVLFLLSGILISALPMIHTHSFLALGVICAGWLLRDVIIRSKLKDGAIRSLNYMPYVVIVYLVFMEIIRIKVPHNPSNVMFVILACFLVPLFLYLMVGLVYLTKEKRKEIMGTWGVLLLVVLVLAFPQLFYWTFRQASEGKFIQGYFNWSNESDSYIFFYIKNLGVFAFLIIPALLRKKEDEFGFAFSGFVLWIIAEFVVFQPNVYDNNKLLLPAYAILCGFVASYAISVWDRIKEISIKTYVAVITLVLCTLSAILTMGREYNSEYELYDNGQLKAAAYIDEHAAPNAVILTDERHNNAISSLTGRNIVCGTPSFLFYHGVSYGDREQKVRAIYKDAVANQDFIKELGIDYIMISSYEVASYKGVNEQAIEQTCKLVYDKFGVKLYQVKK